jgi:hypothetical protein
MMNIKKQTQMEHGVAVPPEVTLTLQVLIFTDVMNGSFRRCRNPHFCVLPARTFCDGTQVNNIHKRHDSQQP